MDYNTELKLKIDVNFSFDKKTGIRSITENKLDETIRRWMNDNGKSYRKNYFFLLQVCKDNDIRIIYKHKKNDFDINQNELF